MRTSNTVSPLRQRMIEDMTARNLGRHSQRSHIYSCKLFARAGTALSVPLYRSRRHLQSPSGLGRRQRHRLPLEGLSHRPPRPLEDNDARSLRVLSGAS